MRTFDGNDTSANDSRTSSLNDNDTYSFTAILSQKELFAHANVSSKNLEAINTHKQFIVNELDRIIAPDFFQTYVTKLQSMIEEKKHLDAKLNLKQKDLVDINKQISLVNQNVENLKQQIKKHEGNLTNVKDVQSKTSKEFKATIAAYQKAKKYYTTHFKFNLTVDSPLNEKIYTASIIFSNKTNYPVKFVIDREARSIIAFDATSFLNSEEQEKLFRIFDETKNIISLVCSLRKLVVKIKG